jgi:hypothetical protein
VFHRVYFSPFKMSAWDLSCEYLSRSCLFLQLLRNIRLLICWLLVFNVAVSIAQYSHSFSAGLIATFFNLESFPPETCDNLLKLPFTRVSVRALFLLCLLQNFLLITVTSAKTAVNSFILSFECDHSDLLRYLCEPATDSRITELQRFNSFLELYSLLSHQPIASLNFQPPRRASSSLSITGAELFLNASEQAKKLPARNVSELNGYFGDVLSSFECETPSSVPQWKLVRISR